MFFYNILLRNLSDLINLILNVIFGYYNTHQCSGPPLSGQIKHFLVFQDFRNLLLAYLIPPLVNRMGGPIQRDSAQALSYGSSARGILCSNVKVFIAAAAANFFILFDMY